MSVEVVRVIVAGLEGDEIRPLVLLGVGACYGRDLS